MPSAGPRPFAAAVAAPPPMRQPAAASATSASAGRASSLSSMSVPFYSGRAVGAVGAAAPAPAPAGASAGVSAADAGEVGRGLASAALLGSAAADDDVVAAAETDAAFLSYLERFQEETARLTAHVGDA
eukprot:PLAT4589.3.p2 GENE.PLAT4589.3~~PLAT4589.3.p2  ORF type:complete len:129 (-),score=27.24 PLAT4589.3:28-414(-)